MNYTSVCFLFCGSLLLAGCSAEQPACARSKYIGLARLHVADARGAAESVDLGAKPKFLAVYGFTVEFPGLYGHEQTARRYGYTVLEGTTDTPCNDENRVLNHNAREYARIYNEVLYSRITRSAKQ